MRRAFAALALTVALAGAAHAAPAGIFSGDRTTQTGHVDPIVAPGERSEHEHCFYGAFPVHTVETSDELRTHATTMDVQTNHTTIWIPCVYEDGQLLPQFSQHGILVYYIPIAGTECVPPEDTAGVTTDYGYRGQTGGGSFSPTPPASTSEGVLVVHLTWLGGRDLGVPCFPKVEAYIRLNVGKGPVGTITIGGPVFGVDGAKWPQTMHGDYFWAHDRAAFERFLAACVRPGRACGRNPAP